MSNDSQTIKLNEVKALLVGDGGAGKTSLLKRLLGEQFDENEPQTHGIKIHDWRVKAKEETINVHFWDFGGQEIMHATHQFFLSKRSLYVLVLDGRKEEDAEYWLKHIESFGGDSPILVVLNKIDQNPGFEINRRFLTDKYPSIIGFYRVSCATGLGIEEFAESLKNTLGNIEIAGTVWSQNWFNVKTLLENMNGNFIIYDEYQKLCEKEGIYGKSSQDTLIDFLNDLGVILHFKDLALLDTHVLEPQWITNAIYRIINSKQLAQRKGVLQLNELDEILKPTNEINYNGTNYFYPRDKYRYIIELMKKFELCYEIDNKTVLIPDLLEIQEPFFDFDFTPSLKFVFEYDFLPLSIMPRFIVRMNRDIKDNLRWRTGVVLEDSAFLTTAVTKADKRDKKIYIYVNGEQKRDYFAVIRKTFRDIHESFERLKVIELVPLPDNPEVTIEYSELIGHEQMGRTEFFIGKLRKAYSVSQLLDGIEKKEERIKAHPDNRYIIDIPSPRGPYTSGSDSITIGGGDSITIGDNFAIKRDIAKEKFKGSVRKEILRLNSNDSNDEQYADIYQRYQEAYQFEKDKKLLKSIEAYEKIIDINEYYKKAWEGLERIYREQGEVEKRDNALQKIRMIQEIADFEINASHKITLQTFGLQHLDFFDDLVWEFQSQMNILLGKNGYGKSHLLRLIVSLLQKNDTIASNFFHDRKESSSTRIRVDRLHSDEIISRTKTGFEKSIGKVPILAIPDTRFIDKSKTAIGLTDIEEEERELREFGASHFLYEKSYERLIQTFLYELCIMYMDKGKTFELPIFKLLHDVVHQLTDQEFQFYDIKPGGSAKFEITVITEGNKDNPLPIQKASQGTLSILSIFGLIYYYLKSIFFDSPEEELLAKPAIVFIDELDAHLHPSWQRKIVRLLREKFPNIQFVVTAHSPLVVAGCYRNEVAVLRKGGNGFTLEQFSEDFIGSKSGDLYKKLFEIDNEFDETYLYYDTQYSTGEDYSEQIENLEAKDDLTEDEKNELNTLYRNNYSIRKVARLKKEQRENDAKSKIAKLEARIRELEYHLDADS